MIEPAAGATRGVLAFLLDAFTEEEVVTSKGTDVRTVLKLHPDLAPVKVAVLPLVKKKGMPEVARSVVEKFFDRGINARYDEQHAIGKRYRRHDEIGTPWCLTVDGQTLEDGTLTLRDRDTMTQKRVAVDSVVQEIESLLRDARR